MKCVTDPKTGWISKVSNSVAKTKVEEEGYEYIDRESHKEQQKNQRNGSLEHKSMEEK